MDNKIPHILIVDDDANLLSTMRDILKMKGFEPVIASTGAAALAQLEQHQFDLALVDLRLDDMSGLIVLRAIKTHSPETECILLTGHASQDTAIEAIRMGVYGYFQKPFDMEQVLLSVQRALEKNAAGKALRESERFANATVDALSSHLAILDETGTILAVNRTWREFAKANSTEDHHLKLCEGVNYLTVCDASKGKDSEEASAMAAGIRAVMSGGQKEFSLEYPCHSPEEKRWFTARVTRFPGEGSLRIVVAHENITERMQAEEKIAQTEKRFRSLIENAPDGIVMIGLEGKYKYASPAALRIFGYGLEDIQDHNPADDTHPEDLPMVLGVLQDIIENPSQVPTIQYRFMHKDGSWRWVESTFTNLLAEPGVEAIVINFRDITERKQVEEAQQQSELQFRALFDLSPDAVMLIDPHDPEISWPIIDCNEAACQMNGYHRDELIGNSIDIVDTAPGAQAERNIYMERLRKAGNVKLETFHRHKNGGIFTVEVSTALVKIGDRELLIGIDRDITERKQAEYKLQESEKRYRTIFDGVQDAIFIETKDGRILEVNKSACEMYGYTRDEFLSKTVSDFVLEGSTVFAPHINPNKSSAPMETINRRANGEIFPIEISGGAQVINGEEVLLAIVRDITARKKDEEALRESEQKYRLLFDEMLSGVAVHEIICDPQGKPINYRFLAINEAFEKMTGLAAAEVIGRTVLEVMPATEEHWIKVYGQVALTGVPAQFENYSSELGKYFEVRAFSPEKGKFATIFNDITERKQAGLALAQERNLLRTLINILPERIYVKDTEARFVLKNLEDAINLGVASPDEMVGKSDADYYPPDLAARYYADDQAVIQSGQPLINHEEPTVGVGNSLRWILTTKVPWRDNEGRIIGLVGIGHDITERKQAEENTRRRVKELELLYQSGLVFSQMLNPKEIAQKIIDLLGEKLDWHHTTVRLLRTQDELELVAFDQPGLEDKAAVEAHFNNLITHVGQGLSGWALQQSKTIRLGDVSSDPHYVATYPGLNSGLYVPLKSGDHVLGVISIESEQPDAFNEADEQLLTTLANQAANAFENARLYQTARQEITERQRVENLLAEERNQLAQRVEERTADLSRVNADLAHAVRVKDEFLASMSHELRTPLTGILGLSEVLQLKIYGELNDKQHNTLKTIEASGRHLLELINDILDLSKIEAGKLELQFAPYSLADICQASMQLIKGMAQHKHQHVNYSFPAEPIIIHADARRLKQLLVNLLSNAIKFTPENGELGLEVEAIQSERKIKLTVWDKGIGIKPEDMNRLFKPFTQLDSGLAREYSGTGLGLSLVRHLTELHNGGIEVQSDFGKGSRFTVILPWSPQNTTPIPYAMLHHGNTGRLNSSALPGHSKAPLVMYVDDNEMVLQMVGDFLEAKQYRVIKVRSGLELLERAAEQHPNIMLVDIQMPGIGGMETIRRIRAHPDPVVAAAPVIAVTALAMPADRERCLRAGANDYMSKPLKLKELAAAIQRLLERKQ